MKTLLRIGEGSEAECCLRMAALGEAEEFAVLLTAAERERSEGLSHEVMRARFVVSRGLRRLLLSDCTGRPAAELRFAEDEGAKPRLLGGDGWDFNQSHAGDYVAVAVRRGAVGIDLEQQREVRDMAAIVDRYFHSAEAAAWHALPEGRQAEDFFLLWSAREAAMKCAGLGLARGMEVTRIDPVLLERGRATGRVGNEAVHLEKLEAPAGYVLVLGFGGWAGKGD